MSSSNGDVPARPRGPRRFVTTRWSLVAAAQDRSTPESREALAALCESYWYPLYGFVRGQGFSADEAQDLTQEFFASILEKDLFDVIDPKKGRFRSFLLTACQHFLANQRDRAQAKKRGGGRTFISIDIASAEARYSSEHVTSPSAADRVFERRWALALLDQCLSRLRNEYESRGKKHFFEVVCPFLVGSKGVHPYSQIAAELGISEGALKVAVHRLRHRYRELLREEIGRTVDHPAQVDEEIRELFAALSSG